MDEAQNGRAAGAGTLGEACNRFEPRHRIVVEERPGDALLRRRVAVQAAARSAIGRLSAPPSCVSSRSIEADAPRSPRTPDRSTTRRMRQALRPFLLAGLPADQILADLDLDIGQPPSSQ